MGDISNATGREDYSDLPPEMGFEPLAPGWYPMEVEGAVVKPTSKGGSYLEVCVSVIGHEYTGRKVWDRITLSCPNSPNGAKAEEIGARQLAGLQLACGLVRLANSA